jgi:hypothetical protein
MGGGAAIASPDRLIPMIRNAALAIGLAALVGGLLAAPIAASSAAITADPATANADATQTVRASVGPSPDGSSLTGLDLEYQATGQKGDVSDVDASGIEELSIDRADGGTTDVSDDVSTVGASNNARPSTSASVETTA